MYETREKKPGILGGALSGYTAWKPVADTQTYKTELYYPGDADIVKFNDTYNWSGKELYGNKKGDHKLGETEYLDNSSLDIAGTTATKRYVYVSSTIQESADMTVTATDSTASASEAASVEAGATVKDRDLIDMTPPDSEEAAETGSNDEPLQVVRMKVIFQMMRIRKVLRLMRTKLTSLPMIHPKVAIPILQELDINTVRMRIILSFVILIFQRRDKF